MRDIGQLVHLLRNTPVRELIAAVERDGFVLQRATRTGGHIYRHRDGRRVVIHYHRSSDILVRKTLQGILRGAGWTEEDLRRLGLL